MGGDGYYGTVVKSYGPPDCATWFPSDFECGVWCWSVSPGGTSGSAASLVGSVAA